MTMPALEVLHGTGVVPWQVKPYKTWSLLEMVIQFPADELVAAVALLERAKFVGLAEGDIEKCRCMIAERVAALVPHLRLLPVSPLVLDQAVQLQEACETFRVGFSDLPVLMSMVGTLERQLQLDLETHVFFCIASSDRQLVEAPERWFGEEILNRFPSAKIDMRDAGRCLGFGQWTASVFHAMGVAELGLREFAKRLQVPFSKPVELENWKNIIDRIEKQVRILGQAPKSQQRDENLQCYSEAASHFFYIKEAWRNHVSHLRGRYDEQEARAVLEHVRGLMQEVASWP